ncbi:molybdenum cofactor guanylyltransferase [Alteribacillus persepolensis]|uniref:Probable molybdenum cofactor guanylyltransferase n=1 Tax=Alteribacillus persepolensis TaxID=568899 RepID=A0A1G7Z6Q7_9BACI|nr:molybdenum cofactor guanylyltransferase [Alteribacillus persepolensis]SDH04374.1 molybdenum cofactor guanylyltransferase [Alteribacillus persepolensis]
MKETIQTHTIAGLVLAGGQSSRYKAPKMFVDYQGVPMYEHSVRAFLNGGISAIWIATNNELAPSFSCPNASILIEDKKHQGPLYALYYALKHVYDKTAWVFILPADTPFVSSMFIKKASSMALHSLFHKDALVPVSGEKIQPLHGIYHRRCFPVIERLICDNRKSMMPLLQSITYETLSYPAGQRDFVNINRKEDWPVYLK